MLYTLRDLREDSRGVTIRLRILSKGTTSQVKTKDGANHTVIEMRVGDRTGIAPLSLWDEKADWTEEGDVVDIWNGYVSTFRGRMRLEVGRYGRIEIISDDDFPSREEILASEHARREDRKYSGGRGGRSFAGDSLPNL